MGILFSSRNKYMDDDLLTIHCHGNKTCCDECLDVKRYLKSKNPSHFCSIPECYHWDGIETCNECNMCSCKYHINTFHDDHKIKCKQCHKMVTMCLNEHRLLIGSFVCIDCINNNHWKEVSEEPMEPKKVKKIKVVRKILNDVEYYMDITTNELYNPSTKECVGIYNEIQNAIIEIDYDTDEETHVA